jgi:hypothetical protein
MGSAATGDGARRERIDFDLGRRNSDKAQDRIILDRDVGDADMVAKLVLARKAMEKAVEVWVSAAEPVTIVARLQPPNPHAHQGSL